MSCIRAFHRFLKGMLIFNRLLQITGQVAIGEGLYEKTGKALTNFSETLPAPDGYLAKELVKNEYSFALTEMVDENNEREVEKALVRNITRTLTELGGGFAYVGHQVRVTVGGEDFWPDLIFYHLKSRRYLVIELKAVNFKPEHIGQLGFYMVAVVGTQNRNLLLFLAVPSTQHAGS